MYVLGLSCYYHDSSAAILKNGVIIAAAEEERFTRKKHDNSFPINAAKFCLEKADITIDQIDYVGFYEKPLLKFERVISQHLQEFPKSFKSFLSSMPSWFNEKLRITKTIKKKLKYKGDVMFVEHHLAHAASTFLTSPYKKAAILTVDGVGEWTTTAYGYGEKNNIILQKEIKFPHSIGLLYSTITAYLGFSVNNSEYKVMGLAPYGDMNKNTNPYYQKLKKTIIFGKDGSFALDLSYFKYQYSNRMPSEKLCRLLGGPIEQNGIEMTKRHKNIAAALQLVTEEAVVGMLKHLYTETKIPNLVISGGVGLNSVNNGKILKRTPFKSIWMQPNSSDGGTSIGVATYIYHTIFNNPRKKDSQFTSAFLGPDYSDEDIKHFLKENKIKYSMFKSDTEIIKKTALMLKDNQVIGWFQGRMEWGPRALGARSILANPQNPNAKELLNLKVKHREKFRPFAPVVCADDAHMYFEINEPLPEPADYMLMVYPIKKQWQKLIPSVTHIDGSGRLQSIRENQHPLYYNLIKEFGKLSNIPILINTSFNIRGEPIVCTPYDAYKCMMGTGIDCLVMGKFLIKREDNPTDMWDSESLAND